MVRVESPEFSGRFQHMTMHDMTSGLSSDKQRGKWDLHQNPTAHRACLPGNCKGSQSTKVIEG